MNAYYRGSLDNHGVHVTSGIPNRAFYLVATELGGTLAAGRIWYEGFKRLTPTVGFSAAEVLASTARAFTNAGALPKGAAQIVRADRTADAGEERRPHHDRSAAGLLRQPGPRSGRPRQIVGLYERVAGRAVEARDGASRSGTSSASGK